ncbi:VanZ family protein [Candidatus Saccharibacteria bacterium]|nr:VanZ family protein [Candidatus Saccharibacteria bacterium]
MNQKAKLWIFRIASWTLFLGWGIICVILSKQDGSGSSSVSASLTRFIMRVMNRFGFHPSWSTLHAVVRESAHFGIHFILALLAGLAFGSATLSVWLSLGFAFIVTIPLATFDEFVQLSSRGRAFEYFDLELNLAGVLTGLLIATCLLAITLSRLRAKNPNP